MYETINDNTITIKYKWNQLKIKCHIHFALSVITSFLLKISWSMRRDAKELIYKALHTHETLELVMLEIVWQGSQVPKDLNNNKESLVHIVDMGKLYWSWILIQMFVFIEKCNVRLANWSSLYLWWNSMSLSAQLEIEAFPANKIETHPNRIETPTDNVNSQQDQDNSKDHNNQVGKHKKEIDNKEDNNQSDQDNNKIDIESSKKNNNKMMMMISSE